MQTSTVPFGVKHAVPPPAMASPDIGYSQVAQRGVWNKADIKQPTTFGATTYRTDGGDSGSDEAH